MPTSVCRNRAPWTRDQIYGFQSHYGWQQTSTGSPGGSLVTVWSCYSASQGGRLSCDCCCCMLSVVQKGLVGEVRLGSSAQAGAVRVQLIPFGHSTNDCTLSCRRPHYRRRLAVGAFPQATRRHNCYSSPIDQILSNGLERPPKHHTTCHAGFKLQKTHVEPTAYRVPPCRVTWDTMQ